MGLTYQLLFWVHMLALALGGVASFGIPVVGSQMATAAPEARPLLFKIMDRLSTIGRAGLGLLIITGPILFWLGWNWTAPNMLAFGAKMTLVVLLLIAVIFAGINGKRAEHGDRVAAQRAPMIGGAAALLFVLVLLAAALAFK